MRTKLFGLIVAALAITAFALPAGAMAAEEAELRMGGGLVPNETEVVGNGTGAGALVFTGTNTGLVVECARSDITGKVTANPGTRIHIRGGVFQNAGGGPDCATKNPRVQIGVDIQRGLLHLRRRSPTKVSGSAVVIFTFRVYDRSRSPTPIGACTFEGEFETETEAPGSELAVNGGAELIEEVGFCPETSFGITGNLTLERASGGAITIE